MIYSREFGDPAHPRVVVMHGLCGSSRNWLSVGEDIAAKGFYVNLLDARDHGMSAWSNSLTYNDLADDVLEWWRAQGSPQMVFVGHSMGGKLAMVLATKQIQVFSGKLCGLCVVDIAPKQYHPHYQDALQACLDLDLSSITSRKQADGGLSEKISNPLFRQFLLSNLYSDSEGVWKWRCNFALIIKDLPNLSANPLEPSDRSDVPVLFVAGSKSEFIESGDEALLKTHFPNSQLEWLPTGHNVHIEARDEFVLEIVQWIKTAVI